MKIRTEADVEKLDARIKKELGIDVSKYRNEEVVEDFAELLVFPEYIFNWTIRPIIASFLLFLAGFFALDLVHIEFILFGLIGFVLFIIAGTLFGLLFLTWKMKTDLLGIMDYSLDIMKLAVEDLDQVNDRITDENKKEVYGLLFKGIIHIVTIPMLSKAVSTQVPFIGGFISRFIKKVLTYFSEKITWEGLEVEQELAEAEDEPNAPSRFSKTISGASIGLNKFMDITFSIAQFPLKIVFLFSLILLIGFLYLIN